MPGFRDSWLARRGSWLAVCFVNRGYDGRGGLLMRPRGGDPLPAMHNVTKPRPRRDLGQISMWEMLMSPKSAPAGD